MSNEKYQVEWRTIGVSIESVSIWLVLPIGSRPEV
jgi:hypothetical protein